MKKVLIAILMLSFFGAYSQIDLYVSTQTGEMTSDEGTGTVPCDEDDESWDCDCSSSGPITFEITPLGGAGPTVTPVSGWAKPDANAAPAGGTYPASISCDCTWYWTKWVGDPDGEDYYEDMSTPYSETRNYNVISIDLTVECSEPDLEDCSWTLTATPYPADGTVTWDNGEIGNSTTIDYDPGKVGTSFGASLDVGGVTFSDDAILTDFANPPIVTATCADPEWGGNCEWALSATVSPATAGTFTWGNGEIGESITIPFDSEYEIGDKINVDFKPEACEAAKFSAETSLKSLPELFVTGTSEPDLANCNWNLSATVTPAVDGTFTWGNGETGESTTVPFDKERVEEYEKITFEPICYAMDVPGKAELVAANATVTATCSDLNPETCKWTFTATTTPATGGTVTWGNDKTGREITVDYDCALEGETLGVSFKPCINSKEVTSKATYTDYDPKIEIKTKSTPDENGNITIEITDIIWPCGEDPVLSWDFPDIPNAQVAADDDIAVISWDELTGEQEGGNNQNADEWEIIFCVKDKCNHNKKCVKINVERFRQGLNPD